MGNMALAGYTALVTGGSEGIGYGCAEALLRDGASVLIMGRRDRVLESARQRLVKKVPGGRVEIHVGDGMKEEAVRSALERAAAMQGRLDIVVATIGGSVFKPLLMHDVKSLRADLEECIVSAFLAIRYGAPLMHDGGSIVCISSASATTPLAYCSTYCAAKGGLEQLVRTAALELASARIRVNVIRPGLTRTPATAGMFADPLTLSPFLERIPLGRGGEASEVAAGVRFLAGPESSYVTGQSFAVDGGIELCGHPDLSDMVGMVYGQSALEAVKAGRAPAP